MTLPNTITLIRIAMIPFFIFFLRSDHPSHLWVAFALFLVASATDGLDGHIARKKNLVTDFGKFLDPTADKLLVCSALILFVEKGWMSGVLVFVILAREFAITSLRQVAVSKGVVMAAEFSGKLKTVVQILGILLILTPLRSRPLFEGFTVGDATAWLMTLVTIYSGIDYLHRSLPILKESAKR